MKGKTMMKIGEIATAVAAATLFAALAGCQTVKEAVTSVPAEWYEKAAAAVMEWLVF